MKTSNKPLGLGRTLIAAAALAAFGTAYAQDDDLASLTQIQSSIGVGVGAVSGDESDRSIFGQFNGMREDRGYFCMPEVDMELPLHPGMTAILQARLPHQSAHEVIATGTRYGSELARERRIVDEAADEALVVPRAIAVAQGFAPKADPAMGVLKRGMYPRVLEALGRKFEG